MRALVTLVLLIPVIALAQSWPQKPVRFIVPFALQLGLYASPVGFSSSAVPEGWRLLYSLNPMVGVIDGFRWAILRGDSLYYPGALLSFVITGVLLVTGLWYFRRTERTFADII